MDILGRRAVVGRLPALGGTEEWRRCAHYVSPNKGLRRAIKIPLEKMALPRLKMKRIHLGTAGVRQGHNALPLPPDVLKTVQEAAVELVERPR